MSTKRVGWIYGLRLKSEPGQYRYLGQTKSRRGVGYRFYHHFWAAKNSSRRYPCQAWLMKYGEGLVTYDILEEVAVENLDEAEIRWISDLRERGLADLNVLPGGQGIPEGSGAGDRNPNTRLTWDQVNHVRNLASQRYVSTTEAAKILGVQHAGASKILRNDSWFDAKYNPEDRVVSGGTSPSGQVVWAQRKFDPEFIESIREEYLKGDTLKELVDRYDVSMTTLRRYLIQSYGSEESLIKCRESHKIRSGRHDLSPEQQSEIKERLKSGQTVTEISQDLGVYKEWVVRISPHAKIEAL